MIIVPSPRPLCRKECAKSRYGILIGTLLTHPPRTLTKRYNTFPDPNKTALNALSPLLRILVRSRRRGEVTAR